MALPVFRAASARAASSGAATPSLPAGSAADDIVILVAVVPDGETATITADGSISTWTAVPGSPVVAGPAESLYAWWGRYSSGTTGPTVTTTADHVCAATVGYSGCVPGGSPVDVSATGSEGTIDTSFSFATGISSSVNDCLALCVASIVRDNNSGSVPVMTNSSLTSLASRLNHCTNIGNGGGYGLSEGAKATAGTLGTFACTYAAVSAKTYIAFALKPAVPQSVTPGKATLTTALFAAAVVLGTVVVPGTRALVTTRFAPTVTVAGGATVVTPGTASLTTARFAPTVAAPRLVTPGTRALTTTRFAPTVLTPRVVVPGIAALTTARFAPTVATPRLVVPGTLALTTARFAPSATITAGSTLVPGAAALTLTRFAPTVTGIANVAVTPGFAMLALAGYAPGVTTTALVVAPHHTLGPYTQEFIVRYRKYLAMSGGSE